MTKTFGMVAKTLYGLEDVLAKELIELGANEVQIGRRVVSFEGDKALMYRANMFCRTALRILKPIRQFEAKDADEVYEQIKRISWEQYLNPKLTFAIDAVVNSETFTHSKFVSYKAKDAIVDYFTEKGEERPSVRVNNPDIQLHLHISHNDCTIALDSSGESLHKRGYRVDQTEAPLNEVLAAGMILKTGWQGECDFIDPMCGSGTLLIEAAMIALNIAPGVYRKGYAFEKWADFDKDMFEEIYNDDSRERSFDYKIIGSDISSAAIEIARENIRSAGFSSYVDLTVKSLQQYTKRENKGIVVTNPPYGERLNSEDLLGLYQMIGERMKHAFTGHTVWVLSYREDCFENIGLHHEEKIKLKNGALDCEFRKYEIFEGKRKEALKLKRENRDNPKDSESRSDNKIEKHVGQRKPFDRTKLRAGREGREESGKVERRSDFKKEKSFRRDKPFDKSNAGARRERKDDSRSSATSPEYRKDKSFRQDKPSDRDKSRKPDGVYGRDKSFKTDRPAKTGLSSLPNRYKEIEELKRKLNKD